MIKVSKRTYLMGLAFIHLGRKYNEKCTEIEKELNDLFGQEIGGHLSDSMYGHRDFDEALKLSSIEVEDEEVHDNNKNL